MSNSQIDDIRDNERYNLLSQILDITYNEVIQLDPQVQESVDSDGNIHSFYIQFDDDVPRHILSKIKGIDDTGTLYIDPNSFNSSNHYDDGNDD